MANSHTTAVDAAMELERANEKFAPFNSLHEGYAVLLEEVDELWDAIKSKGATQQDVRGEAIQVAAMALKIVQFIDGESQ